MGSQVWVQLALDKLSCSQKELALQIGVSPTQITKWKNGEHISFEMEGKFRTLTGIGSLYPEFVIWSGSLDNAKKWEMLIAEIADSALFSSETGYDTAPLQDEKELMCWHTFHTFREMGISLPTSFPPELEKFVANIGNDEDDDEIPSNPYSNIIREIFDSYIDIHGFFLAYIQELIDDERLDVLEVGMEMESCLLELAATKIKVAGEFAPLFSEFRYKTLMEYRKWIDTVKSAAIKTGTPLRAELSNLLVDNHDSLGFEAEAESLGVNGRRIHPDVYLNEILETARMLQRFIPAIAKKLGITPEELALD